MTKRRSNKKRNRTKRRPKKNNKRRTSLPNLSQLIMDPCNGPLDRIMSTPGSLVERTRVTVTPTGADATNGYMLWFPSYVGGDTTVERAGKNFYIFTNADVATPPVNGGASVLGLAARDTTGHWMYDPAAANISTSSIFSRSKSLAACLTAEYFGKLSDIEGQVAVISNLTIAALTPEGTLRFPSIDTMFNYARKRERLGLEGTEAIWRPTDEDSIYRSDGGVSTSSSSATGTDVLFRAGSIGANSQSQLVEPNPGEARGILIAWKGVPAGKLVFNAVKVAEYELAPKANAVEQPMKTSPVISKVDQAVSFLDSVAPDWQTQAKTLAYGAAKKAVGSWVLPKGNLRMGNPSATFANEL